MVSELNTALLTSALDLVWVAATVAVLATVELTGPGRLPAVVMDLAVLQLWFRRRLPR